MTMKYVYYHGYLQLSAKINARHEYIFHNIHAKRGTYGPQFLLCNRKHFILRVQKRGKMCIVGEEWHYFNSLAPGRCGWNYKFVIFQIHIKDRYLNDFVKLLLVNATRPNWWLVNFGSGNGSVPSGNVRQRAITWANFDQDLCHMASLGHNDGMENNYTSYGLNKTNDINFNSISFFYHNTPIS